MMNTAAGRDPLSAQEDGSSAYATSMDERTNATSEDRSSASSTNIAQGTQTDLQDSQPPDRADDGVLRMFNPCRYLHISILTKLGFLVLIISEGLNTISRFDILQPPSNETAAQSNTTQNLINGTVTCLNTTQPFSNETLANPTSSHTSNQVLWASVMWPVIAWKMTLVVQNSGKVCGLSGALNAGLRCNTFLVGLDTLSVICQLIVAALSKRKHSVKEVAQRLWYHRFDKDSDDDIDRDAELWLVKIWHRFLETGVRSFTSLAQDTMERSKKDHSNNPLNSNSAVNDPLNTIGMTHYTDTELPEKKGFNASTTEPGEPSISGPHPTVQPEHQYLDQLSVSVTEQSHAEATMAPSNNGIRRRATESQYTQQYSEAGPSQSSHGDTLPESSVPNGMVMKIEDPKADEHCDQASLLPPRSWDESCYPGYAIDRQWRLSMIAFLTLALPQTIKIFAMTTDRHTKTLVAIDLIGFVVPELLRLVAAPTSPGELRPKTIAIPSTKGNLPIHSSTLGLITPGILIVCTPVNTFNSHFDGGRSFNIVTLSLTLSIIIIWFSRVIWKLLDRTRMRRFTRYIARDHRRDPFVADIQSVCSHISDNLSMIFNLEKGSFVTGSSTAVTIILAIPIGVLLLESAWDGGYAGRTWLFTLPMDFIVRWVSFFYAAMGLRLGYRLLFMGSWSTIPRKLTGITGSLYEFLSGYIMIVSLFHVFAYYALGEYNPRGTYKPPWTEYLG